VKGRAGAAPIQLREGERERGKAQRRAQGRAQWKATES